MHSHSWTQQKRSNIMVCWRFRDYCIDYDSISVLQPAVQALFPPNTPEEPANRKCGVAVERGVSSFLERVQLLQVPVRNIPELHAGPQPAKASKTNLTVTPRPPGRICKCPASILYNKLHPQCEPPEDELSKKAGNPQPEISQILGSSYSETHSLNPALAVMKKFTCGAD